MQAGDGGHREEVISCGECQRCPEQGLGQGVGGSREDPTGASAWGGHVVSSLLVSMGMTFAGKPG